jgi:hypothetical protein
MRVHLVRPNSHGAASPDKDLHPKMDPPTSRVAARIRRTTHALISHPKPINQAARQHPALFPSAGKLFACPLRNQHMSPASHSAEKAHWSRLENCTCTQLRHTQLDVRLIPRSIDRRRRDHTPNVDHLVKLQKDREFYECYIRSEHIVCDSRIIYFISSFLHPGNGILEQIAGSDLLPAYCQ